MGGIDAVVAAAGIIETNPPLEGRTFDMPGDLAADRPPPPWLKVLAVNLTGVSYTAHLALFWLPRNSPPKEEEDGPTEGGDEKSTRAQSPEPVRDRHLLLISSIAGLTPLPGQTEYTVSKHAVMGLFRAMRGNAFRRGIRCNVICPYFVNTPLLPPIALGLLAGGGMTEMEDVVDAATRLVADESIVGRGLVVGPKMYVVDGDEYFKGDSPVVLGAARTTAAEDKQAAEARQNEQRATWEIYAHDYEKVEVFVWRYIAMVNRIKAIRGFIGTIKDLYRLFISRREKK
ncbi:hypothetical protein B0T26DRAFT_707668 [Lasiosphaeria miniovina]|uniref:Uncharacterized protein n=1 Tax=Lasiosphaeria miniovina TaxID=1954250 RepID=A0AA40DX68_9PEZI|nr:uncharacterized protein B0T26DRAFT_707668 [Lasiosphaeria miniovina]KAK0716917.1 hypothetical protein B0T26DRAFT_707668 [Lasiosphaeria miniovina]